MRRNCAPTQTVHLHETRCCCVHLFGQSRLDPWHSQNYWFFFVVQSTVPGLCILWSNWQRRKNERIGKQSTLLTEVDGLEVRLCAPHAFTAQLLRMSIPTACLKNRKNKIFVLKYGSHAALFKKQLTAMCVRACVHTLCCDSDPVLFCYRIIRKRCHIFPIPMCSVGN
jgi:hypothetical protein